MSWKPFTPAITSAEVERIVMQWPVAIIQVYNEWNVTDRMMAAVVYNVALDYGDFVACFFLDMAIEANEPFVRQHDAHQTPALLCFVRGKLECKLAGYLHKTQLRAKIADLLDQAMSSDQR